MLTAHATPLSAPPGTVCLTFDDGPGPQTLKIAQLLASHGMRATFFVLGKRAEKDAATVRQVHQLGHWIGNHTFHHRPLAALLWAGNDVESEIVDTHRLIADLIADGPFLLRPPYGNWSAQLAAALNRSAVAQKYIGPILWDIDFADHGVGGVRENGPWTLARCSAAYLNEIEARQRGVVLLHDGKKSCGECPGAEQSSGGTLELVERIVMQLKGRFEFKSLDEIVGRPQSRN